MTCFVHCNLHDSGFFFTDFLSQVFQWSVENIQSQLPLQLNGIMCFTLCINGVSEFLSENSSETAEAQVRKKLSYSIVIMYILSCLYNNLITGLVFSTLIYFDLVTFDLLVENLNISHIFKIVGGTAFIISMCFFFLKDLSNNTTFIVMYQIH